jgi:hypothetical protein
MQSEAMLTLLVAAVVLSLLDHLDGYLSVLVLKRVCGRRARSLEIQARAGKQVQECPTIPHLPFSMGQFGAQGKAPKKP